MRVMLCLLSAQKRPCFLKEKKRGNPTTPRRNVDKPECSRIAAAGDVFRGITGRQPSLERLRGEVGIAQRHDGVRVAQEANAHY